MDADHTRRQVMGRRRGHGRRRSERSSTHRRWQVVATLAVVFPLEYATMRLAAASVGYMTVGLALFVAPVGLFVWPAVAGALIAAADAGRWIARSALIVLIVGLPMAILLGWFADATGASATGDPRALLVIAVIVSIPSLVGFGVGTSIATPSHVVTPRRAAQEEQNDTGRFDS